MKPMILLGKDMNAQSEQDCEGGDCACSIAPVKQRGAAANRYFPIDDIARLRCSPLSQTIDLDESHKVRFGYYHSPVVLDSNGNDLLEAFENRQFQHYDLRDVDLRETITKFIDYGLVVDKNLLLPFSQEIPILTAWLHITDRCNLRCSYCYLPHVREDMSDETGRETINAIFRSALANGFKQVKIKYAGGEPLLRFPFIVELHKYAQSLVKQNNIALDGVVLSNGTLLTDEIIKTLKSLSLRLMISLDGLDESHDRHRPYAGGRGSFADVSSAARLALDNGLIPNISVTVSGKTAEDLPKLISWILEHNLPFSLNFYRENELSASNTDMRLDEEKIVNGMLAAFKVIEANLPRRSLLPALVDRANLSAPHLHTCGVGQNYLVFDQNGQVAKCQMHIRKPITDIHVADPLAVIRADQIGIQNLSVEEKEGCRTCEWKYWCAGGCSLATYRATGRYDVKSPNCNIYKALYPEAVRLEGLRLLKYADDPEVVLQ